ncbi:TetR-like C-terminal domain-containing protein [Paenibacillus sinopodophylli]|uniref:TetR-like C-terminal domain-containing protein n=1 Tax=Paenibacillus sinopodophylli TaxID=1837342 RepID=UPI00110D0A66|nr:TetR-like C-terminal domain-containing protein [Paenibacillus sinopodophylli]
MIKTNKKILQTKQALRNALWSLIEWKGIQDITVSQVCSMADINRTTFYKYYSIPLDILTEYVEEMCEQVLQQISKKNDHSSEFNIYSIMLDLCRMHDENKQIMKIYMEFNRVLLPIIQKVIVENLGAQLKEPNQNHFISGGVSAIIFQWSLNGYQQKPEDIAKMLTKYIDRLSGTNW